MPSLIMLGSPCSSLLLIIKVVKGMPGFEDIQLFLLNRERNQIFLKEKKLLREQERHLKFFFPQKIWHFIYNLSKGLYNKLW